jgi:hypothetical protein
MYPGPSRSTTRTALMTWVVAMTYRRRVSLGSSKTRTRCLEKSIVRSSSTHYVSSIQQKELDFFNNLYRGARVAPAETRNG